MINNNSVVNDNQLPEETKAAIAAAFSAAWNAAQSMEFAGSAREAFSLNMAKAMSGTASFRTVKEHILNVLNTLPLGAKKAIKGNVSNMLALGEHVACGGMITLPDRKNKQPWEIAGKVISRFGLTELRLYGEEANTSNFALSSVISAFQAEKKATRESSQSSAEDINEALSAFILRHGAATDDALSIQIRLVAGGSFVSELDGTSYDYAMAITEGRRIIAEERAANEAAEQTKAVEAAYHQSLAMVVEAITKGDSFAISTVVAALNTAPVVNDNRQAASNA